MRRIPVPKCFQEVAKHRQFLYGFAALWIMFYHLGNRVPAQGILKPLWFLQTTGACGVEIFLILTGMGLYSSMKRDPSLGSFFKKRFVRVFLPAFILMAFYCVSSDQRLVGYLGGITFFGYWIGVSTTWYVPFILTMYLIYPLVFKLTDKHPKVLWTLALAALGLSFLLELMPGGPGGEILRSISRIPMFLIGCALAPHFAGNKRLPRWLLPVSAAATVPLMWLSLQMYKRGPFYSVRAIAYFAYAVALVLLLSAVAEMLSRSRPGALVYRFFGFCGLISLEIYLIFSRLRILFSRMPGFSVHSCGNLKLDVAAVICTLLCAVLLQRFTEAVIKSFSSVRIPAPEKE